MFRGLRTLSRTPVGELFSFFSSLYPRRVFLTVCCVFPTCSGIVIVPYHAVSCVIKGEK